jgi:hypothetical protein
MSPAMMGFNAGDLLRDNIFCADRIYSSIRAPCKYMRYTYTEYFSRNLTGRGEERSSSKGSWEACNYLNPIIKIEGKNLIVRSYRTFQMK